MTGTNRRSAIALAATIAAFPALALAQATPPAATITTPTPTPSMTTQPLAPKPATGARRASQIIGADIYNEANNEIGEVHGLMVQPNGGAITAEHQLFDSGRCRWRLALQLCHLMRLDCHVGRTRLFRSPDCC